MSQANVLFLSPHLDDVALSCSKCISALAQQGFAINVLTLFTESNNSELPGSRPWETVSYKERQAEDIAACKILNANVVHLGLKDAPYRSINEFYTVSIKQEENFISTALQEVLTKTKELSPTKIFSPLGVGWHIDHLITHEITQRLRLLINPDVEFFFYEDRPYVFCSGALSLRLRQLDFFTAESARQSKLGSLIDSITQSYQWATSPMTSDLNQRLDVFLKSFKRNIEFSFHTPQKAGLNFFLRGGNTDMEYAYKAISAYKSQINYLFGSDKEFYKTTRDYSLKISSDAEYCERIWVL